MTTRLKFPPQRCTLSRLIARGDRQRGRKRLRCRKQTVNIDVKFWYQVILIKILAIGIHTQLFRQFVLGGVYVACDGLVDLMVVVTDQRPLDITHIGPRLPP